MEEKTEGFPESLLSIPECVALFKTICRRFPSYLDTNKVSYWERMVKDNKLSLLLFGSPKTEKSPGGKSSKAIADKKLDVKVKTPKKRALERVTVKPEPNKKPRVASGAADLDSSDDGDRTKEPQTNDKSDGRAASYCANWLLQHFKIGERTCGQRECRFQHSVPPTKSQVQNFADQLPRMSVPLPDADWDRLLVKLGARPRKTTVKQE